MAKEYVGREALEKVISLVKNNPGGSGSSGGGDASSVSFDNSGTTLESTDVQGAVTELFTSVSNGKALIASAITDKGVETPEDASFEQMAENISNMETDLEPMPFNAINWDSSTMPLNVDWFALVYGKGRFLSGARAKETRIAATVSGTAWNLVTMPAQGYWQNIAFGNGIFVATACDETAGLAYSTDGINWTAVAAPVSKAWSVVVFGGGKFVVSSALDSTAMYSTDGINWTLTDTQISRDLFMAYGAGKFLALKNFSDDGAYSLDGINWTAFKRSSNNSLSELAYYKDRFFMINGNGVMVSEDGFVWTAAYAYTSSWVSLAYGEGFYILISSHNYDGTSRCLCSTNRTNWSSVTSPGNNLWRRIVYGGGQFVAVGESTKASRKRLCFYKTIS